MKWARNQAPILLPWSEPRIIFFEAERIQMAMADCRDTVLRAIHVDLLLGRDEVGKPLRVQCASMELTRRT